MLSIGVKMYIGNIISGLKKRFDEREGEISCLMLAALSGEHAVLIGPDIIEDNSLIKAVAECFDRPAEEYLLTSGTSLAEISGLGKGSGFLIMNEVFNASSPVTNSLMKRMKNDAKDVSSVIGTARNIPNEDDDMFPFYSSFLLRETVTGLDDEAFLRKITGSADKNVSEKITKADLEEIRKKALDLSVEDHVMSTILFVKEALKKEGIIISDIRWQRSADVLRIAAAASGKKSVDLSVVPLLQYILWDRPETKEKVRSIILEMCTPKSADMLDLRTMSEELLEQVVISKGAIDENAGFPRVVYCYDCDGSFVNLKRLKDHNVSHPRHAYADPNIEGDDHRYKRYGYSDLVTLLTTKYRWEIFKDNDTSVKEGFLRTASELHEIRRGFERGLAKDREALNAGMKDNPWLSSKDKDDLIEIFDRRCEMIEEIGSVISDAETMME